MQYDIDGVLSGHDGELEINAEIRIADASVTVHAFGTDRHRTIAARKPSAVDFVDELAGELLGGASIPRRRKPVELVMCPDCLGGEPEMWECQTCRGGGKIPG